MSEADHPVHLGRRGQPARSGYRPDKTPSRERRLARTERMPVVHGPEWPGPTTCPPAAARGRRRYLCSSNIKTPGTSKRAGAGEGPARPAAVSARLRGDFSRRRRGVSGCGDGEMGAALSIRRNGRIVTYSSLCWMQTGDETAASPPRIRTLNVQPFDKLLLT